MPGCCQIFLRCLWVCGPSILVAYLACRFRGQAFILTGFGDHLACWFRGQAPRKCWRCRLVARNCSAFLRLAGYWLAWCQVWGASGPAAVVVVVSGGACAWLWSGWFCGAWCVVAAGSSRLPLLPGAGHAGRACITSSWQHSVALLALRIRSARTLYGLKRVPSRAVKGESGSKTSRSTSTTLRVAADALDPIAFTLL